MSIEIEKSVLEKACKEMIETILFCLPSAFKGTIYRVGKPPSLITERITSGVIQDGRNEISWGLPENSEYNPPGKPWAEYRDQPGRPIEAMGWCVENQKSWTSEDPLNDSRSVRLQVEGKHEDFHHMEPVLVRKSDLRLEMHSPMDYPSDYSGSPIWRDTEYVVVAVIKIHFQPHSIRIGSPETLVIRKLSRSLGTQLLSYQLRQESMRAMEQLNEDRLSACNVLADSLRNAITKAGMIFSLIKQEIGSLREQWEEALLTERNEKNGKVEAVRELNEMLAGLSVGEWGPLRDDLMELQTRFLELSLPPDKGENWVNVQIKERWKHLFAQLPRDNEVWNLAEEAIEKLKKSLRYGQDAEVIGSYRKIPDQLKKDWVKLIYSGGDRYESKELERLIGILSNPGLGIPYRERSRKTLTHLKALAETMSNLERTTNLLLRQILNGSNGKEFEEWQSCII